MKKLLSTSLLFLTLSGCAFWQKARPFVSTAEEAAALILCQDALSIRFGISPKQARDMYCDNRGILEPFLQAAQSAKVEGETLALQRIESVE